MLDKIEFRAQAEKLRSELRTRGRHGSSSDLHISELVNVAIIGIQTSEGGSGHDTIYLIQENLDTGKVVKSIIMDMYPTSGRVWPSGISKDGKMFTRSSTEYRKRYDYDFETGAE